MINITNTTTDALMASHTLVNEIVIAIAIFLIGLIIGRIIGKLVGRFIKGVGLDDFAKKHSKIKFSFEKLSSGFISFIIYIIFLIIALNYIGITSLILNVLSSVIIIIIAIIVVLSIRDSVPNIIAFRKIIRNSSVKIGDTVEFDNVKGVVKEINAFETQIENKDKDMIHVPNSMFVTHIFKRKKRKVSKK